MRLELTPAAQRALEFATRWSEPQAELLEPSALLMGLLEEPACRAALLLADRGIAGQMVREHWPELIFSAQPADTALPLSPSVEEALLEAEVRLADHPRPLTLATEHLLLGLAVAEGEVSAWLRAQGLELDTLEREVRGLWGRQSRAADPTGAPAVDLSTEGRDAEADALTPTATSGVLRVLDAAANRAGEGLRVVEDYARFVLDDRFLTARCKLARHELAALVARLPAAERHAARETRADVGATLTLASEQSRADLAAVVAANWKRVEQSLRSLEEFAKTVDAPLAAGCEHLRYETYTLERIFDILADSQARLADARLYVITDGRASLEALGQLVDALVEARVDVIQLRDKRLADRELLARARLVREKTRGRPTLFVMNDRPDLALLAQADGVHVGQDEVSVKDARSIVGPRSLIGVSTHSLEQAQQAVLDGASYLGVGPTFPSGTKAFSEFPGVAQLRQVAAEIRLPAFAIGGIDREHLDEVRSAGFDRVAVSRAVVDSPQPGAAAAELRRLLRGE